MATDADLLRLANDSGFPLQIAVERVIGQTSRTHGWEVRYSEHAWTNVPDQRSGFIDLVLQTGGKTVFLVVECKRVREATWLFMHSSGEPKPRRHAKSWVSNFGAGRLVHFGWHDIAVDPPCPEAAFCAIRGQSASDRNTLLERIGSELISATEALAVEERDFRPVDYPSLRFYFNIIVTTADLKIAKFNSHAISLADGTIGSAAFESVPYLRFRKQLSMRPVQVSPQEYNADASIGYAKENTVFVVRAEALVQFLSNFNIPDDTLSKFHVG